MSLSKPSHKGRLVQLVAAEASPAPPSATAVPPFGVPAVPEDAPLEPDAALAADVPLAPDALAPDEPLVDAAPLVDVPLAADNPLVNAVPLLDAPLAPRAAGAARAALTGGRRAARGRSSRPRIGCRGTGRRERKRRRSDETERRKAKGARRRHRYRRSLERRGTLCPEVSARPVFQGASAPRRGRVDAHWRKAAHARMRRRVVAELVARTSHRCEAQHVWQERASERIRAMAIVSIRATCKATP